MTRYYLDTEFAEYPGGIDLISLALVCEDGRELYCVNNEFDRSHCNDWVKKHVLPQLPPPADPRWINRKQIVRDIVEFVGSGPDQWAPHDRPVFWAYYASYDWVLFCQLFGTMMDMPHGYPQLCMDIMQYALTMGLRVPLKTIVPQPLYEHDALFDARWNKAVHETLIERYAGWPR